LTLIEAIIYNLPVLSTSSGGSDEILANGQIGYLAENRNASFIAALMFQISKMPSEAKEVFVRNAYQYAKQSYNIDKTISEWNKLYSGLIDNNKLLKSWDRSNNA